MADEPVNTSDDTPEAQPPEGAAETTDSPQAETSAETGGEESAVATLDIGSEAATQVEIDVDVAPTIRGKVDKRGIAIGTGRRKTAVARVRVQRGSGQLSINGQELNDYFPLERDQQMVLAPLKATSTRNSVDVWVRVDGGGTTGQTGAVVLGIARALQAQQPDLHHTLSEGGFLTRDGRMVERKKYGFRKARRSFQFSKR
jgi:small subunit ribosomal protein S9